MSNGASSQRSDSSRSIGRTTLWLVSFSLVAGLGGITVLAAPGSHPGNPVAMSSEPSLEGELPVVQAEFEYIGSRKCRSCHLQEYRSWQGTQHADVFDLLEAGARAEQKQAAGLDPNNDYTTDTECLECHTVGFGEPSGFVDLRKTKDWAGVGCESCHGPGESYARDSIMGLKNRNHSFESVIAEGLIYPVPAETCEKCHNERSPFNVSVDPKYAFEYTRENIEAASHRHPPFKYKHGPLPPGVMFQEGYSQ